MTRLLSVLALVAACSAPPPVKPTTGSVTGTVALAGRTSAEDAIVSLDGRALVTDATGAFRFDAVPPGSHALRSLHSGFVTDARDVDVTAGKTTTETISLAAESVNRAPQISSLALDSQQLAAGATTNATVTATDADGDALTYTWRATGGFTVQPGADASRATVTAPAEGGAQGLVQVFVDDGKGGVTNAAVPLSTRENRPPVVESFVAVPPVTEPNGAIDLTVAASDPDDEALTYAFTAPDGWTLTFAGATAHLVAPDAYGAVAEVHVTATDPEGATATAALVVSTSADEGPRLASVVADPPLVARGQSVQLRAVATHPNGDALAYAWTAPDGWTLVPDAAHPEAPSLVAPATPAASGLVQLVVTDAHGKSVTGSVAVMTLPNHAPVVSSVFATPPIVAPGGTVHLAATATDADGDPLTFTWTAPDGWTGASTTASLDLVAPGDFGASGLVHLVVSDGFDRADAYAQVATAVNDAPVITFVGVDPAVLARNGAATLRARALDSDGQTVSLAWAVSDASWSISGTGDEVTLHAPDAPARAVTVTVTASDGQGGTSFATVTAGTVADAAPELVAVDLDPAGAVTPDDTVALVATATDADDDALTYDWTASTGWTIAGTGASVTLTAPDDSAATGQVSVTVSDGWGGHATRTLAVATRDVVPDAFAFEDVTGATPSQAVVSNAVTVGGFDGPLTATCTGCEASRNGGAFAASVDGFVPGDTLTLRQTASSDKLTTTTASVSLGRTKADWSVTTRDVGQLVYGVQQYGAIVDTNGTYGIEQLKYYSASVSGNLVTIDWPVVYIDHAQWTGGGTPTDGHWHGLHAGCGNVNGVATCTSVCLALGMTYDAVTTDCGVTYPTTNMNADGRNIYMSNNAGVPTGVWNTYTPDPAIGNGNCMEWCRCSL